MKNTVLVFLLFTFVSHSQEFIKPDLAPEKVVTNTYHGVTLEDPYQYLENLEDPEVLDWMKANANYAQKTLDNISGRETMFNTIKELYDRKSASIYNVAITDDDIYYYVKRQPGEEIGKVYRREGYKGKESLFFDPNGYTAQESEMVYTVSDILPSHDGETIAIGLQPGGSENTEVIFITKEGAQLPDKVNLAIVFFWNKNNNAIFYTKFNSADLKDVNRQMAMKIYEHKMGADEESDSIYLSMNKNPDLGIKELEIPIVVYDDDSDKFFCLAVSVDKSINLFFKDPNISSLEKEWKKVVDSSDKVYDFWTNEESIYYLSFKDAPNFKIVQSSWENPSYSNGKAIVPEFANEIINDFNVTKDGLYFWTTKNGVEASVYFLKHGQEEPVKLELPFSAGFASIESKGSEFSDVWITIEGWTSPSKRFKYDPVTNTFNHEPLSTPTEYPELKNLVSKEVMVKSHDGVMVPVSIVHNKNIKLDGTNSAMILGYGSYGISMEPFFSPITLAYTTQGGILVVPHVRGGGELGDAWHRAGQKLNKPNTWKDAIATAEHLIENGYTSNKKLSIIGGSAGGIFVGRSITERPDLFAAGAPMVGAMNTVRMEVTPNGPVNTPEFGTVEDSEEFKGLLAMDSYHNLKKNTDYPAMYITSGFNDPRVIAWEPAKFAAKMQRYQKGNAPILFQTNFDQGHGGRTTMTNTFNEFANIFSFVYWQSGHPDFQPKEKVKG